jgi:hypothetical protein
MTMEAVCILKEEKPDWDTVGASTAVGAAVFARQRMVHSAV